MASVKISELTEPQLNWAVAQLEKPDGAVVVIHNGMVRYFSGHEKAFKAKYSQPLLFSSDWGQGGPIIERERLDLFQVLNSNQWASKSNIGNYEQYGSTPLTAAMRCHVASKLGDTVEIPEVLL